jgi:periplasmic copper chaperone A
VRVELGGLQRQVFAVEPSRQCLAISFTTHVVIVELYSGEVPDRRNFVGRGADYKDANPTTVREGTLSIMRRTNLVRAGVALAVAAVAVFGFAAPASAHVTVNPSTATQGGFTKVTFRVPDEKDTANTVKLEVTLPADNPIASVSVKPIPGWTAVPQETKLKTPIKSDDGDVTQAVTKITWTADPNAAIKPGQFQEFDVSLGPLPKVDQLVFKALQYYSDGDVVRWIEEPSAGAPEPEHPAPILKLTAASAAGDATTPAANTASTSDTTSTTNTRLAVTALVVAVIGVVLGALAYRKAGAGGS